MEDLIPWDTEVQVPVQGQMMSGRITGRFTDGRYEVQIIEKFGPNFKARFRPESIHVQ